jgi:ABC-type glycerol-3-phosphate transport system substrate-binding protein
MRKYILITLLVALALVVASCAPAATPTPAEEEAAPVEEAAPAAEEEAAPVEEAAPEEEAPPAEGEVVELTIESWRNDDITIWQDSIIPAFEANHPNIKVTFAPTAPAEYNGVLNTKLEGGTAGDLITCRPFDRSLGLYDLGHLASINDLSGMENFSDVAKSAWITDDGSNVFCVPMASVIHGFFYNADAFAELGLEEPTTRDEFFAVLDAIKEDGTYAPLGMGSSDQWEALLWASRTLVLTTGRAKKVGRH